MRRSDKFTVTTAIKKHLARVGSKGWRAIQERYPDVPSSSFWRYLKEVKADIAAQDMRAMCEQVLDGRPASTSGQPAAMITGLTGDEGHGRRADYLGAYKDLYADAVALRASALNADLTIRSPAIFDRAIRARQKILTMAVRYERQVYELKNVQAFIDALLEEAAHENPEFQRRVVERLRKFAEHSGLSRGRQ